MIRRSGNGFAGLIMGSLLLMGCGATQLVSTPIENIDSISEDFIITQSIFAMSRSLSINTVAEGVETESHLNIIKRIGIDGVQGYYFSKPLSKKDFIEYLKKSDHKLWGKSFIKDNFPIEDEGVFDFGN